MSQLHSKLNALDICRYLIICELITILFSPAISNLLEIMLFAFCIFSEDVRANIWKHKDQPLFIGAIAFICMLIISTTWSVASTKETFESLWGWRKILLLPIAITLFQEDLWKEKVLNAFIFLTIAACTISYISFFLNYSIHGYEPGVLLRSHTTQGVVFALASFAILTKWTMAKTLESKLITTLTILGALALIVDVIFLSVSRSGYLASLTLASILAASYFIIKRKIFIPISIAVLIPAFIFISPVATDSIHRGVNEVEKVDQINATTSMGIRIKLWGNTIEMIKEKPLLGVGLGGFRTAYSEKVKDAPEWHKDIVHDPHNQFIKITAEQGIIGLVVFIFMLATSFFQKTSLMKYQIMGLSALLVWCLTGMFNASFSTFTDARFIYIWLGVMLASNQPINKSPLIN